MIFSPFSTRNSFALWLTSTLTPSAWNCFITIAETSASSRSMMRGAISTCVTCAPKRAKHWVSSQPIGPPPSTTRRLGRTRMFHTVSEVRGFISFSPGIGGTNGRAPAAMTMLFVVKVRTAPSSPLMSTAHGDLIFACPRTTSTPRLE